MESSFNDEVPDVSVFITGVNLVLVAVMLVCLYLWVRLEQFEKRW